MHTGMSLTGSAILISWPAACGRRNALPPGPQPSTAASSAPS